MASDEKKKSGKGIIIVVVILLLVIILGAVGGFFIISGTLSVCPSIIIWLSISFKTPAISLRICLLSPFKDDSAYGVFYTTIFNVNYRCKEGSSA